MNYLIFAVLGYLSGSVLYAYYLSLWLRGIDITADAADGNPGVFNCVAHAGKPIGLTALVCDLLKGALPVLLAVHMVDPGQWPFALVLAAPVAGHAFSIFRRFDGGKAITVTFGVTAGLLPMWLPLALLASSYLFFTLIVKVKPNRCRSIIAFLCFGMGIAVWMFGTPVSLGCILASVIVVARHWEPEEGEEKVTARFVLNRRDR